MLSRFSRVQLFVTPWTVAHQAPRPMGFSRQEDYSGLPCPPPGDLPHPGIEPESFMSPALAGKFFTTSTIRKVKVTVVSNSTQPHGLCSFVHGILQARILRGLPSPSPGDLPDPKIEATSPTLQADSLPLGKAQGNDTRRQLKSTKTS